MRAFVAPTTLDMQLKKILITFVDTFTILDCLEREFRALGIEVERFATNGSGHWLHQYFFKKINRIAKKLKLIPSDGDLFAWSKFSFEKYREDQFAKAIERFKPDLIFCIHGHKFGERVLQNTHISKIGWWIEPNPNLQTLIRYAKLFDLYYSYDSEIVELLKGNHVAAEYQSHVASTSDFYPIEEVNQDIDVLFYGAHSPWRQTVSPPFSPKRAALPTIRAIRAGRRIWVSRARRLPHLADACIADCCATASGRRERPARMHRRRWRSPPECAARADVRGSEATDKPRRNLR